MWPTTPMHFSSPSSPTARATSAPVSSQIAIRKLNLLQPEFVMSVGDLIEGSEDREIINAEWDEFDSFVEALEMPFFYVPGNHDIGNQVMADIWEQRFGRSYYSFVYRDVLFVCLNTESPETRISTAQIAWLEDELAAHKDVRWTLVFMHKPLWAYATLERTSCGTPAGRRSSRRCAAVSTRCLPGTGTAIRNTSATTVAISFSPRPVAVARFADRCTARSIM